MAVGLIQLVSRIPQGPDGSLLSLVIQRHLIETVPERHSIFKNHGSGPQHSPGRAKRQAEPLKGPGRRFQCHKHAAGQSCGHPQHRDPPQHFQKTAASKSSPRHEHRRNHQFQKDPDRKRQFGKKHQGTPHGSPQKQPPFSFLQRYLQNQSGKKQ